MTLNVINSRVDWRVDERVGITCEIIVLAVYVSGFFFLWDALNGDGELVRQSHMCASFGKSESSLRPHLGYVVLFIW
jgi:hypothetical protein